MALVEFGTYTEDAAKKEAAEMQTGDFAKIPGGESVWRFLPPPPGQTTPFVKGYQHYIKTPQAAKGEAFPCLRVHGGVPCFACKQSKKFKDSGQLELAREFAPSKRIYARVIKRGEAGAEDEGPLVMAFGAMIYKGLNGLRTTRKGGDYSHPLTGFDVIIERTGTGMKTEYKVMPDREDSQLGATDEIMNEWLSNPLDLKRYITCKDAGEMAAIIERLGGGDGTATDNGAGAVVVEAREETPKLVEAKPRERVSKKRAAQDDFDMSEGD